MVRPHLGSPPTPHAISACSLVQSRQDPIYIGWGHGWKQRKRQQSAADRFGDRCDPWRIAALPVKGMQMDGGIMDIGSDSVRSQLGKNAVAIDSLRQFHDIQVIG